jgi:hypothetical protein
MAGRPSDYTPEMADLICLRLSHGETLIQMCRDANMPVQSTVYLWLQQHSDFSEKYQKARQQQADYYAEEQLVIADTTNDPQKAKLQMDARKWFASKVAPKKYGEKVTQELSGPDGGPIPTSLEVSFVRPSEAAKTED